MKHKILILLPILLQFSLFSHSVEARSLFNALSRTSIKKIMRQDLKRDALTIAKPLAKPRTVYRYTSKVQATNEARLGISPGNHGVHTTTVASPGHPLSAEVVQKRYGLSEKPQVRETILLPQGVSVKKNKVLGGEAGYGEFNLPKPIPNEAIHKITPLQ